MRSCALLSFQESVESIQRDDVRIPPGLVLECCAERESAGAKAMLYGFLAAAQDAACLLRRNYFLNVVHGVLLVSSHRPCLFMISMVESGRKGG